MSKAVRKVALVAAGAALGFVTGGVGFAIIGGAVGLFVGSQQDAALKSGSYSSEPSAQTVRSSKAPARYILGRASTGGVLVWAQEQSGDQTDGEWVHLVYVLSEGAIAGLDGIYLGEEEIAAYGEYASYELLVDPSQVNAFLRANCRDWRDTQIGRGLSFIRLSLKHNAEKFPSGIPDVRFVVRGRNDIYDPRTGMTGYSDNTALHMLWFLRARCKVPDDEIVFETFASAANVCDEAVANADGTAGIRYRTGCVIGADEQRTQVIQKLEESCAGQLIRVGGKWMMQAGAYYGPYDFEITEDMIVGTVSGTTEVNNDSAINIVTGTFIDPSQTWAETDFPEVRIQQWVDEDGGEAAESMSLGYVTDAYQAQRLANIKLRRARAGGSLQLPMNFAGYNCRPGRVVRVNLPSLNIIGEFIVTDWNMAADDGCTVTVSQYEPAIFDDAVGQPYNPIGFINLPTGGLGSPTNLAWVPDETAEVTQGVLSWTQPAGIVTGYAVTIRQGSTAVQAQQVPETTVQLLIAGLSSGNYTMSVAALGPLTRSGEASITVNIDGPPIPEACTVRSTIDSITLFPSNVQHGLNGGTYEYFFSLDPQVTADQATYLGQGLSLVHTDLAFFTNYFYFIRSRNAYGVSAFLKIAASTSTDVSTMIAALEGKIQEGQLWPSLQERIDLIDGNGPGSVNERIGELRDEIDGLVDALAYDPDKAYLEDDAVRAGQRLYQAIQAVPAAAGGENAPPNPSYWLDIGQVVESANGLAAQVERNTASIEEQDGRIEANAEQISAVRAEVDDPVTGLNATANGLSTMKSTVETIDGKVKAESEKLDGVYAQVNPAMAGSTEGFAGSEQTYVGVWSEQSARIEDGIATAKRIDTVQVQQGETNAAVQQVSQAVVGLDGKVNAQVTIKAQTIAGGRKVTAGLALGSNGETSEFLAFAQRFAVVDEVGGQVVAPLVVQNGQVFINTALINQAFIQQIILGMTLRSQAVDSQGRPLIELNMVNGTFTLRGQDASGSVLINNGGLYVYDANGVERVAAGRLT
ncbi:phage tail tip fiber protein [Pseudomonas sp. SAR267]|uniref:phage tail protein n=1 Tax=Pseudomonas sp. SAR267 TaxID=3454502 RepID=UPI003F92E89B